MVWLPGPANGTELWLMLLVPPVLWAVSAGPVCGCTSVKPNILLNDLTGTTLTKLNHMETDGKYICSSTVMEHNPKILSLNISDLLDFLLLHF